MAPHLTPGELDWLHQQTAAGKTPVQVHALLRARRARQRKDAPDLTNVRRVLRGKTYRQGLVETRGRKRSLSRRMVLSMDRARKTLTRKAAGQTEVRWRDIVKKARAPPVHRSTASASFKREGIPVAWRRPRERPQRTKEHEEERVRLCRSWAKRRGTYFSNAIDLIIDNKKFETPTNERARQYLKKLRVRGHLRTPAEGLKVEYTRPSRKKNRMNTGGSVSVCAGISNGRIVLWHYLPRRWNGEVAASLYKGPIMRALKKHRGQKRHYHVLEDNDPTGYKSRKAQVAKADLGIHAVQFPRYSPDLNPLDFSLWMAIEQRVAQRTPDHTETVSAFKIRLRRVAMRLPEAIVCKAVESLPRRVKAVIAAKGQNIPRD